MSSQLTKQSTTALVSSSLYAVVPLVTFLSQEFEHVNGPDSTGVKY